VKLCSFILKKLTETAAAVVRASKMPGGGLGGGRSVLVQEDSQDQRKSETRTWERVVDKRACG
jgi:hypothetical protein